MNRYKKISIPHLPVAVRFCVTEDVTEARKSLQVKYPLLAEYDDIADTEALCTHEEKHYAGLYWITLKPTCTLGTVAHEALHVVASIYDYIGVEFDPKNHEHYAYLLGYIVDEISKEILKEE